MSAWDVWTWIAIGVLELGSVAVFGWFLVEVVTLARKRRSRPVSGRPDASGPSGDDPGQNGPA